MNDMAAIENLMTEYFRILHEGDTNGIEQIFLPTCDLNCPNADGSLTHMTRQQYIDAVKSRETPKGLGYPKVGTVKLIDQAGPNMALVKVDCAVQPRHFTDYLTLIKQDGDWKIAAKVYYVTAVQE